MNKFAVFTGTFCATVSALSFVEYFSKPDTFEADALRGASAYVQQYNGAEPNQALDYAQHTVDIVAHDGFHIPELSELEQEISTTREQMGDVTFPPIYQALLEPLGEKMENIADNHRRDLANLFWGLGLLGLSALDFYVGIKKSR